MYLMGNRQIDPFNGLWEYILFDSVSIVRRFVTSPSVASRYCKRYNVTPASPMTFYGLIICKESV